MADSHFKILKIEKLPESEAVITGEISLPFLVESRSEAIRTLGEKVDLPGFRKGKIPEDVLVKKLGEMKVLEESAEIALGKEYPHIIEESKLRVASRPFISITKLAPGIALEFQIRVALEPEFKLPDYKKLASESKEERKVEVSKKEVDDVVKELKDRNINPELAEGEKLEDKIRENIEKQKKHEVEEKNRLKLLEVLVKNTSMTVPKALIENELVRMLAQFKDDISRVGLVWNKYLEESKKTEEDIKKEWTDKAVDRIKADLIMAKIAEVEKLEPNENDVDHEVTHLLSHYPDADPMRARLYIYTQLKNQKVFDFLENIDGTVKKKTVPKVSKKVDTPKKKK
jgi:FKBP-type peptidyl-prolyl cis-trans isomerase (trigger factor)